MRTHFNLLLVEDSPTDADLLLDVLREAGFDPVWRRVETQTDYLRELNVAPDLILSDFSLLSLTGKQLWSS